LLPVARCRRRRGGDAQAVARGPRQGAAGRLCLPRGQRRQYSGALHPRGAGARREDNARGAEPPRCRAVMAMLGISATHKTTILPEGGRDFLRRRMMELVGVGVAIAGVLLLISIFTFSNADPSL